MATDGIIQHAAQAVGRAQGEPRPIVADRQAMASSLVDGGSSTGQRSSEAAAEDDYQWLLRWYPLFMAGVILTLLALGGFWISRFAI
jgi:hypothetical protein